MAEENPVPQSFFMWAVSALGWKFALLIPLAAVVTFILTLIVVIRGKGMTAGPALVFIVPLPALVGFFGAMEGVVAAFSVLGFADVELKVSQLALVASETLVRPIAGLLAMVPSYVLAMLWLFIRSLLGDSSRKGSNAK